ncbi:MAG: S41 family peptidase [Candidatus Taylorbacteria bacterium]|nr:S41 family peptidase [Candidatus Taylorbacteria bacterium]
MKNSWPKQIPLIIVTLLLIAGVYSAGFYSGKHSTPDVARVDVLENKELAKPQSVDFAPFWKAWNILNEKYVAAGTTTPTTNEDKVWGAIEGLASSLHDPYTVFFPPEENKLFTSEIKGNFEGVGMQIGIKDDILTVIAPLKGTPAEKAGLLPGDKILKIDDFITSGIKEDEAVRRIRGTKGTQVNLTIFREGKKDPLEIKVTRDTIAIPTIDTELKHVILGQEDATPEGLLQNGIFTIRLYSFSETSPELFRDALRQFIESGSNKLILDLRGNPGGYLEAAVDIASWFLAPGKVVVSEDFGKNAPARYYKSHYERVFNDNLKFVILVNGGSASASEILAGALQEYGVAKLVGTETFGKGVVQELIDITPETSLKVTVARWLTPNGNSISSKGVSPDVLVKMTEDDILKGRDPQMAAAQKLLLKE